jgi:hypothetical protein
VLPGESSDKVQKVFTGVNEYEGIIKEIDMRWAPRVFCRGEKKSPLQKDAAALLQALAFASRYLSPCGYRLGLQTLAVSLRFNRHLPSCLAQMQNAKNINS